MTDPLQRLALVKRVLPRRRETEMSELDASPIIEKTARAISDWHSERDWPLHIDQAKRCVEAMAELLQREGFRDAAEHLRTGIWEPPAPRRNTAAK
jgi:hypothetical protein